MSTFATVFERAIAHDAFLSYTRADRPSVERGGSEGGLDRTDLNRRIAIGRTRHCKYPGPDRLLAGTEQTIESGPPGTNDDAAPKRWYESAP